MLTHYRWELDTQSQAGARHLAGGFGLATVVAVALLLAGCAKGPLCPELESCGGSPVGQWAQRPLSEDSGKYCQENTHIPPLTEYLQNQPSPTTRVRVPESTNVDWCYNLILTANDADALKKNLYWWENLPYKGGLVKYTEDGQFSIDFGREGRVHRYYSDVCLSQYGHHSGCAKFQELLIKSTQGAQEYNSFECTENAAKGGCDCSFNIGEANSASGSYSLVGSTITHFGATPLSHFSKAAVCVRGDTMLLSGQDNSFLWDRASLRTIELVRVNCSDGKQGPGEAGVDCGLRCPTACPE